MKQYLIIILSIIFIFSCKTINGNPIKNELILVHNSYLELEFEKNIVVNNKNISSLKMQLQNGNLFVPIIESNDGNQNINIYNYDLNFNRLPGYKVNLNKVTNQYLFDFASDQNDNLFVFRKKLLNNKIDIKIDKINKNGKILNEFKDVSLKNEVKSLQPIKVITTTNNEIAILGYYSVTDNDDTVGFIRKYNSNSIEEKSFRKDYNIKDNFDILVSGIHDSKNNLFVAGYSQKYPNNIFDRSYVEKYNQEGELIWSTNLNINGNNVAPTDIKLYKDDKIYVSCIKFNSNGTGANTKTDTMFYILNSNGEIENSKKVDYSTFEYINDFFILSDGNIIFSGDMMLNNNYSTFINFLYINESESYSKEKLFIIEKEESIFLTSISLFQNDLYLSHNNIINDSDNYVTLTKINIR